jgi:3-hydroxybutyryl-CoA dehydrogenase
MGPFQLSDFSGLDTKLFVSQSLQQNFGERFRSTQSLKNRVAAGFLGRKSGEGWYRY